MNINDGGPAFPVQSESYPARDGDYTKHETIGGMSLRDYFAAKAINPVLIEMYGLGLEPSHPSNSKTLAGFAKSAYAMADAMLAAREAQP